MTVPGRRDPDKLGRRAGVRADPAKDQHFLIDERVLDRLPGYLPEDASTAHVLEIGGGVGALTDRLVAVADRVTVVERDPDLASFLREEFTDEVASDRLRVVQGDALEIDLPRFTASVSNLPYSASSELAFRLLPAGEPLVLTFQREFAERMAAEPGDDAYGRLSVTAGHFATVDIVEPIPSTAFNPQPAVESAVVAAIPRTPDYEVPDEAFFLRFVTAVFTQRRKTLRNAIRNTTHISGIDDAEALVEAADASLLDRRPETVSPAEFARLARLAVERGDPQ